MKKHTAIKCLGLSAIVIAMGGALVLSIASCSFVRPIIAVTGNSGTLPPGEILNFSIERKGIYSHVIGLKNFNLETFDVDANGNPTDTHNNALAQAFLPYEDINTDESIRSDNTFKMQTVDTFPTSLPEAFALRIKLTIDETVFSDTYYTYYKAGNPNNIHVTSTITDSTEVDNLYKDPNNSANNDHQLLDGQYNAWNIIDNTTTPTDGYVVPEDSWTALYEKWLLGRFYSDMVYEIHDMIAVLKKTLSSFASVDIPLYCIKVDFTYNAYTGEMSDLTIHSKDYKNQQNDGPMDVVAGWIGTIPFMVNVYTLGIFKLQSALTSDSLGSQTFGNYYLFVPTDIVNSRLIYHLYPTGPKAPLLPYWHDEKFYPGNGGFGWNLSDYTLGLYFNSYYLAQVSTPIERLTVKEFNYDYAAVDTDPSAMPTVNQPDTNVDGINYADPIQFNDNFSWVFRYKTPLPSADSITLLNPSEPQVDYSTIKNFTRDDDYKVTLIDNTGTIIATEIPYWQIISGVSWYLNVDDSTSPWNGHPALGFRIIRCYQGNGNAWSTPITPFGQSWALYVIDPNVSQAFWYPQS
ncbi:MAG: hypothetical protein LBS76_00765 [Mycoplasmataceae bacterium]|nr:hypothetical protein [Mycoplasmataceae bacterium]